MTSARATTTRASQGAVSQMPAVPAICPMFFSDSWRPPLGRSFIGVLHCGHSSRICRGSVGEGEREGSKR